MSHLWNPKKYPEIHQVPWEFFPKTTPLFEALHAAYFLGSSWPPRGWSLPCKWGVSWNGKVQAEHLILSSNSYWFILWEGQTKRDVLADLLIDVMIDVVTNVLRHVLNVYLNTAVPHRIQKNPQLPRKSWIFWCPLQSLGDPGPFGVLQGRKGLFWIHFCWAWDDADIDYQTILWDT